MFLYITLDGKRTTVEIKYPPNFEELKQSLAHSLSIRSDETENLKILIKHPRSGILYEMRSIMSNFGDGIELYVESKRNSLTFSSYLEGPNLSIVKNLSLIGHST